MNNKKEDDRVPEVELPINDTPFLGTSFSTGSVDYDSASALKVEAIRLAIEICKNQMHIDYSFMLTDSILDVAQKTYDFLIDKRKDIKC